MVAREEEVPIKALRNSEEILKVLEEMSGANVTCVAEELDKPLSTVYDYLQTLKELEYIVERSGNYHLSSKFLAMGSTYRENNDLYRELKTEVNQLQRDLEKNVLLMQEESGYGVILYSSEYTDDLKVLPQAGSRLFLHAGAGGKAILSELPEERVDEIIADKGLPELGKNTITEPKRLYDELEIIQERGYAVDDQEAVQGISTVAVPVVDESAVNVGALVVYGPATQFDDQTIQEVADKLLEVKNIADFNLSYT